MGIARRTQLAPAGDQKRKIKNGRSQRPMLGNQSARRQCAGSENQLVPGKRPSRERSLPGIERVPGDAGVRGTRASANTSGPDFTVTFWPGEIAEQKLRTERRKPVSSAGSILKERTL